MAVRSALRERVGLVALAMVCGAASGSAQTVPPLFSDTLVADVGAPTGLAFTPDGRLLITTQGGALRVYQSGRSCPRPP